MRFTFGPETIAQYRRLSYKHWTALAEFVDNSTQSFLNHRDQLEAAFEAEGSGLRVEVSYDPRGSGLIRISDNAMGMNKEELEYALVVGAKPANAEGRSRYGMGMKTAACWLGDKWTIRTKRLGDPTEYEVELDVNRIADGDMDLDPIEREKPVDLHYTEIEISELHKNPIPARTKGKIKDYLSSMYRVDITEGWLDLYWEDQRLEWTLFGDDDWSTDASGNRYFKEFQDVVEGKPIKGWIGVLGPGKGSRAKAGFGILHSKRVIMGWPDAWRPEEIFGQLQGSNNLLNQRLCGEIELDAFEVTQAKDDILWVGDEEDLVGAKLRELSEDYIQHANERRSGEEDSRGPSDVEVSTAVEEFEEELQSGELSDRIILEVLPDATLLEESLQGLIEQGAGDSQTFSAHLGKDGSVAIDISGWIDTSLSPNDPYCHFDVAKPDQMVIVINQQHPHFRELKGADGVLNHLRNCTYDALAEWKAAQKDGEIGPATVRMFKDSFLRVGMEIDAQEMKDSERS